MVLKNLSCNLFKKNRQRGSGGIAETLVESACAATQYLKQAVYNFSIRRYLRFRHWAIAAPPPALVSLVCSGGEFQMFPLSRRSPFAGLFQYCRLQFLAIVLCSPLAAMDWPLPDAAMVRNFGYNDQGRPALGTVFEGEGEIFAADAGEVLFSCSGKDTASRLPTPLGAWTAVDHGDGLVSVYGRYRDDGRRPLTQTDRSVSIAAAGSSGWSKRDGCYFLLYDRKERRWVNASMVITPFPDIVPPQIPGIQLRNADGRLLEGGQLRSVSQGRYTVIVNTVDTLLEPRGLPLAPHRISCSANGEEAGSLSFETICARDGILMVNRNGLIPARRVYAPYPAFEAGEVYLSRGQAILEIIVHDITGNSQSVSTRMIVE